MYRDYKSQKNIGVDMEVLKNIGEFKGFEFGIFRLKDGVREEELLKLAKDTDDKFISLEDGYLGHALLKAEDGLYADIAFATTEEKAKEICNKWMSNEYALRYIDVMNLDSVNISFWNRIK